MLAQIIGQDHLIVRAGNLQSQRIVAAFAQEIEISPAQIVLEIEIIVLRRGEQCAS